MDRASRDRLLHELKGALAAGTPGVALAAMTADALTTSLAALPLPRGCVVLGLGGLARRELAPFSDVDVMVLLADDAAPDAEDAVAANLTQLWDAGFRLGTALHRVGSLDALFSDLEGKAGHAATALLDARPIAGDGRVASEALRYVRRVLLPPRRDAVIRAKLQERLRRLERTGLSPFANEPDIKDGAGGLREIHTVCWVGLAVCGEAALSEDGDTVRGLLRAGFLSEREAGAMSRAREALLRLRTALHLGAGRKQERLDAEHAARAAMLLGGTESVEAGEAVAREAVLAGAQLHRVADAILSRARPPKRRLAPTEELGMGFFARDGELHLDSGTELTVGLLIHAERLLAEQDLALGDALVSRREAAVEVWGTPATDGTGQAPATARALRALCSSTAVRKRREGPFTRLLLARVWQRVLADMARLDARVTHDGIHALSTDAHLCACADHALALVSRATPAPEPLQDVLARAVRTHLLVLAALLHDIGKGLAGDHSEQGEQIAVRVGHDLALDPDDVDTLQFLVREHLSLSRTAQRRDLSDPAVIEALSRDTRNPERLDLLALLTWVDMQAVGPGVATEWKAQLLRTAVDRCRAHLLQPGGITLADADLRAAARVALAGRTDTASFVDGATARFLSARSAAALQRDLEAFHAFTASQRAPLCTATPLGDTVHEVRVLAADRPGLLASIAAGLASEGASILDAVLDTRSDGLAFDAFIVDNGQGRRLDDAVVARIPVTVVDAVQRAVRATRRGVPRARVEPRVRATQTDSWGRTIVEVRAADRVGLLAELAQVLSDRGFTIALARIHTEGPRVTDMFTVEPSQRATSAPQPSAHDLDALCGALLAVLGAG